MVTGAAYFTDHFLEAFSWMLIHSLWQGVLLAMACALALMAARNLSPKIRYRIVFFGFILFVAGVMGTFFWYWDNSGDAVITSVNGGNPGSGWVKLDRSVVYGISAYFSRNAPVVVLIWFVLFALRFVKIMRGLLDLNRLRSSGNREAPGYWQDKIAELCSQIRLNRKVKLLESSLIKVPVVLGHFSPVILIPIGLLTGMPATQLEAVLLHELAHIRRHDFLVNLVQGFTETVFFFNPGLLWISELLKQEREHCCDELAVQQTGSRKDFVQALVTFKEYALAVPEWGVGFPGQKNQLLDRASRILGLKRSRTPAGAYVFVALSGFLLVCLLGTTLTAAQISAPGKKSKPIPVELTRLFQKEAAGEDDRKASQKIRVDASRQKAASLEILADTATMMAAVARIPDSLITAAALSRKASDENAQLAEADRQRAEQARRKSMADKAQSENAREQAEAYRLETIRNKSHPIPANEHIIAPISKK